MNTLDIIFLALIGISVIYSLIRGLIREIFSFLAIILGFFGASYGYSRAAEWLKGWVDQETVAHILGFAILFLLIALGVSLLGKLLSKVVHKGGLGWADRMGGAAFGLLKAILLIAIILLVLTAFLPPKSKLLLESKISPAVVSITRGLSFLVPERFQNLYAEKEKELKKYWSFREFPGGKPETKGWKKI
ncbi:MAG: CvpA family protein [Syntrophaceae bacterium]|jgi:membrane protein required for colicin V production|nr:CvpA family protein [Syntrophaceae bacterium]